MRRCNTRLSGRSLLVGLFLIGKPIHPAAFVPRVMRHQEAVMIPWQRRQDAKRHFQLFLLFDWMDDDDDISQHSVMAEENTVNMTTTSGYRPIEAWHEENRSPTHVLDSLKREQAHWKGKFEDLGGDGI